MISSLKNSRQAGAFTSQYLLFRIVAAAAHRDIVGFDHHRAGGPRQELMDDVKKF
jgi:hypothetical protein